jgi:hypothetical protein
MLAAKIPFVDVGDITDVVSKVIIDDAYNGQTITVTGPQKRTFKEVIEPPIDQFNLYIFQLTILRKTCEKQGYQIHTFGSSVIYLKK